MLVAMIEERGSDLHLTVNAPPTVRVNGRLRPLPEYEELTPEVVEVLLRSVVTDQRWKQFERDMELDFAYSITGVSRFRVNMYRQRGSCGAAFRAIPHEVKNLTELGVPESVTKLAQLHRGLVLVTGPTGS